MQPFSLSDAIVAHGGDTIVGALVGKSASTVSRWRTRQAVPSPGDQPALARVLGVSVSVLSEWCALMAAENRHDA